MKIGRTEPDSGAASSSAAIPEAFGSGAYSPRSAPERASDLPRLPPPSSKTAVRALYRFFSVSHNSDQNFGTVAISSRSSGE